MTRKSMGDIKLQNCGTAGKSEASLALPRHGTSIYVEGREKVSNTRNQPAQDPKRGYRPPLSHDLLREPIARPFQISPEEAPSFGWWFDEFHKKSTRYENDLMNFVVSRVIQFGMNSS